MLERSLLSRGTPKRRVAREVGRVTHRRIQRLVADEVDSWLESLDQLAVLLREWCGNHYAQPLGSVGHINAFPEAEASSVWLSILAQSSLY